MKDKDKIIIVVYAGTRGVGDELLEYLGAIAEKMNSLFDETVVPIVIPRRDTNEIWLECINPQLVSEEKYKEAEEAVEKIKKMLEENKKNEDENL